MLSSVPSDVTAVVLTLGEASVGKAYLSLDKQTLPVKETILIKDIRPFHRALNLGASKVRTRFFIQVDSDMELDPCCVRSLRECFQASLGMSVGCLRDPLRGRTSGIKMFRTECFRSASFPNTISPDTDFRDHLMDRGWGMAYALRYQGPGENFWHTFGNHRPAYTQHYTVRKYLMEGKRYHYRRALGEFKGHFERLAGSQHEAALAAQAAMAHGIFMDSSLDLLDRDWSPAEVLIWDAFYKHRGHGSPAVQTQLCTPSAQGKEVFKKSVELGFVFRENGAFDAFADLIRELNRSFEPMAWVARIALCHGLFSEKLENQSIKDHWSSLRRFIKESKTIRVGPDGR